MKITGIAVTVLAAGTLMAQVRFDYLVRNDLFAGFAGNAEALKRGLDVCEKTLAENPNHPEALVWHGIAMFYLSGQEFQKGNQQKAAELTQKGLGEMDRAVALAPNNLGVRIPRGAALRTATHDMPDSPARQALIELARTDYQLAFDIQQDHLDAMGSHPLGELLQGLGDLYSRQGRTEEAQKYYNMIEDKVKSTVYAKRAAQWLETRQPLPAAQTRCVGCHTGK